MGAGENVKTKAAVMWASSANFEITELELDPPKANEVLVRSCASTSSSRHVIPSRGSTRAPTTYSTARTFAAFLRSATEKLNHHSYQSREEEE